MRHFRYIFPMFVLSLLVGLMQLFALEAQPEVLFRFDGKMDKVQHFLAGSACGIFGVWVFRLCNHRSSESERLEHIFVAAASAAFVIGFAWEVLEHILPEMNGGAHSYVTLDTQLDLVCDTLGGLTAVLFYRNKRA